MKKILLSLLLAGGVQNSFAMQAAGGGQAGESGSIVEREVPVKFFDGSVANLDLHRLRALNSGLLKNILFTEEGLSSIEELSEDNAFPIDKFKDLADFQSFENALKLPLQGEIEDMVDFCKKAIFLDINTYEYLKGLFARDGAQFFKLCRALLAENEGFVLSMQRVQPAILHEAIRTKDPDFAKMLIKARADVKVTDRFGHTALKKAAYHGHTETVQLLIDKGAYVNARDGGNDTALMNAAFHGHTKIAQLLIDKGADVNASNNRSWTALMNAVSNGHTETVQLLINKGADVNASCNEDWTPLILALRSSHTQTVRLLLNAGANIKVWCQASYALDLAENDEIRMLLAQEMIKDGVDSIYLADKTMLIWAVQYRMTEIVRFLISAGANPNYRFFNGSTALHAAMPLQRPEIAELLINAGADVNARDDDGETVLMLATDENKKEIVQFLINKEVDVNARDSHGRTALMRAAAEGCTEIARLLIATKADFNARDNGGRTARMIAAERGHTEIVQLLRDHGAV